MAIRASVIAVDFFGFQQLLSASEVLYLAL
jgi:hypothetical protein